MIVHVITKKGPATRWPRRTTRTACTRFAGAPCRCRPAPAGGRACAKRPWTQVFGDELAAIGARRPDVVAITAAMLHPTGLAAFASAYPDRVFDVGIAEQHAVTSAAGLAMGGLHPVVAIYSTFLNRAFDQVMMDVALHRLPVTFVLDRAGVTGPDGASHHGMWDGSILQVVPGMAIAAPRDGTRLAELLREAVAVGDGPTALRFPSGTVGADVPAVGKLGGMDVLRKPAGGAAAGRAAARGGPDGRGMPAGRRAPRRSRHRGHRRRPALGQAAGRGAGGRGPRAPARGDRRGQRPGRRLRRRGRRLLRDHDVQTPVQIFGLPQQFLEHGERGAILADAGLDAQHLARLITEAVAHRTPELAHDQPG